MGRWLWNQGTHCVASTCEARKSHHWTKQSPPGRMEFLGHDGSSLREIESAGGRDNCRCLFSLGPKFSESQLEDPAGEESAKRLVPGS